MKYLDGNGLKYFWSKIKKTIRNNIAVNVTPTAIGSYNSWDTQKLYGYKATITVNGLTTNSMIENIIMSDTLMNAVAPVVTTGTNSLIFYTQSNELLSGLISMLITSEVE